MTKELRLQCGAELAKPQAVEGVLAKISREESDRRLHASDEAEENLRKKVKEMGDKQRRAWANAPPIRFTI